MDYSEFKKIISSINTGRDIVSRKRGSEENVKVKIIVPLLQFLGFDLVKDMDFEVLGADVVLINEIFPPLLITETQK